MANALGYVTENDSGFEGNLKLMDLSTPIQIVKNGEKTTPEQPDYRVLGGRNAADIGAAWFKKAKSTGRKYLSFTLADPMIGPRKIYANLAPVKGEKGRHVLLWNPTG